MAAIGAQASGGSKETQRSAQRTSKALGTASLMEIFRGIKTRNLVQERTREALTDPRAAAERLNPFSNFAADVVGRSASRGLERTESELAARGVTGSFRERILNEQRITGRQDVTSARLQPVQQLLANAPAISEIGLSAGVGGLASASNALTTMVGQAAQRESQQGSILGLLLGGK